MPDFFMLGNAPNRTHESGEINPGYDIRDDKTRKPGATAWNADWWVSTNQHHIQPGDMFALYLHPETAFYAVGVFTSFVDNNWVDIAIRRLDKQIARGKLVRLVAWKTPKGTLAKPFSLNPDGTPNAVFANGTRLTEDRWSSIWTRLSQTEQRWLQRASRKAATGRP